MAEKKFVERYIYVMHNNPFYTCEKIANLDARCIDYRFWNQMRQRGDRWYWGWVVFNKEIPLWDAMDAGLVPLFRKRKDE